jgi:hypothetical protein
MNRVLGFAFVPMVLMAALAQTSRAGGLTVNVQLPQLNVAEYHRPYVAVWIEGADQVVVANLAVWYEVKNKEGSKWLADLRQWWRRSGRDQQFPIDGVTGATRPVGQHILQFDTSRAPLARLPAGEYQLAVEVVREVGGREVLRLPLRWPPQGEQRASIQGSTEIGAITLQLNP